MQQKWINTQISKEKIQDILSSFQNETLIYIDLEEWQDMEKPVQKLQKSIIETLNHQFNDLRLEKYDYLDEALERIDKYYNLQIVIVIENWHLLWNEKEYQRFLQNIFKNGILKRDIKLAILNGNWMHEQDSIHFDSFQEIQDDLEHL